MPEKSLRLRVMTFNIRIDTKKDGPKHTWAKRKDAAAEIIRSKAPDVVGMQEALGHQLADLRAALPAYEVIGRSRDTKEHGESTPVLYLHERFAPLRTGNFWLSDTPDAEASLGWDAPDPRICTWALLSDRDSSRSFMFLNTHLDRWGTNARTASVQLIVAKIIEFGRHPSIVVADLNSREDGEPYRVFEQARLRDSYRDVHEGPPPPTIHHYGERLGPKIDFVFCDPNWRVVSADVVQDRPSGQWPSDHYPVTAELELLEPEERSG